MNSMHLASARAALAGLFVFPFAALAQEGIGRASHPSVSPDGQRLAFSWQGDIWTSPISGGDARRLTVHLGRDMTPRWTPDGKRIVFTSDRFGTLDLFSMSADGNDLRRLTYGGGDEYPTSIAPDGKSIVGYVSLSGSVNLFRVPITGGEPALLTNHPEEISYFPSVSPDGTQILFNLGASPGAWRKPAVRGSNTGEIWIAPGTAPLGRATKITENDFSDLFPAWDGEGGIVFVSNRTGSPNLWRMGADGKGAKQLTQHGLGTVRWPNVGGGKVAYEFDNRLWVLDLKSGKYGPVNLSAPSDQRASSTIDVSVTTGLSDYAVSPDGKRAVVQVRGDLYLIPEKGGTTRRLTTLPSPEESPVWLDNKRVLFVGLQSGKKALYTVDLAGKVESYRTDEQDLAAPLVSPDGKWVAMHRGANEIVVCPVAGGDLRILAKGYLIDGLQGDASYSWSPDNKWLALFRPEERGGSVVAVNVESGVSHVLARVPRYASAPKFLPNGKGLYFTSLEDDEMTISIIDLVPQPITFAEDDLDGLDETKKSAPTKVEVEIQTEGIERRVRRLVSSQASALLASPDSKTIWANVAGQLSAVPTTGGAPTPVASVNGSAQNLKLSANGQKVYAMARGGLVAITVANGQASPIGFAAQASIDAKSEERALFGQIVWALERFYYDPKLHGRDWAEIKSRYEKALPLAADRTDFYALMGEMLEELDSSHMGASGPPQPPVGTDSTPWTGITWDSRALDARGSYIVQRVSPHSPAAHPQSELKPGDRVITVDGETPSATRPISAILNRKAGKKVRFVVEREGKDVSIDLKPAESRERTGVEYENWVAWNRKEVERLSNGQLTYLHIQGMNDPSHRRFLREIRTLTQGKKGVVIDVRFNGGGSTAHEALGVLIKTPWLDRTFRGFDGKVSENIYRGDSLEMPSCLLINQYSFSNAEILAEGFRRLKIGPIIGERTAGGVIGTGSFGLLDGGMIRMPSNGTYTIDGENLERNGRRPDIEVKYDPNAWAEGRDPVLERAVAELLKKTK